MAPSCAPMIQRSPSEPPKLSDRKGCAMARRHALSSLHRWTTALVLVVWLLFPARALFPQDSPSAATSKLAQPPSENGFPVKNALVVSKCGGCHASDAKGNMSRISWIRTTPEGWEEAIKRMVRLPVTPWPSRSLGAVAPKTGSSSSILILLSFHGSTALISSGRRNVPAIRRLRQEATHALPSSRRSPISRRLDRCTQQNGPSGTLVCARRNLKATGLFPARNPAKESSLEPSKLPRCPPAKVLRRKPN